MVGWRWAFWDQSTRANHQSGLATRACAHTLIQSLQGPPRTLHMTNSQTHFKLPLAPLNQKAIFFFPLEGPQFSHQPKEELDVIGDFLIKDPL